MFKGVRFNGEMYERFKCVVMKSNITITEAFERFMNGCIQADCLVYDEAHEGEEIDYEIEARVLVDWLNKGKFFYRTDDCEETSIQGRLIALICKVKDKALKKEIEEALKSSVKTNKEI